MREAYDSEVVFLVIFRVAFVFQRLQVCCLYSGYSPCKRFDWSVINPLKDREQIPFNQNCICMGQHLLTNDDVVQCDNESPSEAHHCSITVPS
jgi:hypothetical protein